MTTPTIARLTGPYGARTDRKTYWRLVLPGERLESDDEACIQLVNEHKPPFVFRKTSYVGWVLRGPMFGDLYRRRVTVRPKSQRKGGGGKDT